MMNMKDMYWVIIDFCSHISSVYEHRKYTMDHVAKQSIKVSIYTYDRQKNGGVAWAI